MGRLGDCGEVDEWKRLWGEGTVERWKRGRDCVERGLWRGGRGEETVWRGDCGEVDEGKRLWGEGGGERWMRGRDCGETGGLWRLGG